jgi:hypothetical protein
VQSLEPPRLNNLLDTTSLWWTTFLSVIDPLALPWLQHVSYGRNTCHHIRSTCHHVRNTCHHVRNTCNHVRNTCIMFATHVTMFATRVTMFATRVTMFATRVTMFSTRVTMFATRVTMVAATIVAARSFLVRSAWTGRSGGGGAPFSQHVTLLFAGGSREHVWRVQLNVSHTPRNVQRDPSCNHLL